MLGEAEREKERESVCGGGSVVCMGVFLCGGVDE